MLKCLFSVAFFLVSESDFVRISPALLASSSILAAARGLKVLSGTVDSVLKLTRCETETVEQIISVIESLVSNETSTLPVGKPPTIASSVTPPAKHSSSQEDARQPETPTDVQEVHFWKHFEEGVSIIEDEAIRLIS